jgi:hypothetical protein
MLAANTCQPAAVAYCGLGTGLRTPAYCSLVGAGINYKWLLGTGNNGSFGTQDKTANKLHGKRQDMKKPCLPHAGMTDCHTHH